MYPFGFKHHLEQAWFVNSVPLSVWIITGGLPLDSILVLKAFTSALPVLFFNGITQAYLENTSIRVSKNLNPRLYLDRLETSTKSWISFIPTAKIGFLGQFLGAGLCSVYTSCPLTNSLTSSRVTLRLPSCCAARYNLSILLNPLSRLRSCCTLKWQCQLHFLH